ncbi:MAG: hypothetical protein IPM26_16610 [Saprospiraceae bacterium]|nr:hypothetical protein [Saprospiraceae bacterium]
MELAKRIGEFARKQPKDFAILIMLLFFILTTILFWLKLNGQKIQLPFLENYVRVVPEGLPNTVTTDILNKYSKIVGNYKYRCKSKPKNHGGVLHIEIITTDNGLQWKLTGERRWEEIKDTLNGTIIKKTFLDIPYQWETTWGDFITDNKIAYRYEISRTDKHIKGYAEGLVDPSGNISCNYWQLPPDDPLYGSYEFKRVADKNDTEW